MARGRPRQFDVRQALEAAMVAFWTDGYASTSCEQLLEAMEINSGSMYAAFGDKKSLFVHALKLYEQEVYGRAVEMLNASGSPLENIKRFLRSTESMAGEKGFRGCLVTNTLIEFGHEEENELADYARKIVARMQKNLEQRLTTAQEAGELNEDASPAALAAFLINSLQGLSVMGRTGMSKKSIRGAVDTIINALR